MGPSATARFYQLLIEHCQKKGLKNNSEYPYIVIYNLPVPDLIADQKNKDITLEMVISGLKKLENFGADFIVIPCNTIHSYIAEFRKSVNIPIISLIEKTVESIDCKKVGIIGSKTTITEGLYQNKLKEIGVECSVPSDLNSVSDIIKRIISGKNTLEDKLFILKEIREMNDIEGVILGCTELPLIIGQKDLSIEVFDTLDILAERAVMEVMKNDD